MINATIKSLIFLSFFTALFACDDITDPYTTTEEETESTIDISDISSTTDEAEQNNQSVHEDASDYIWAESDIIEITLNGTSISGEGDGYSISGATITIQAAGTYRFSGTLNDGQITVDTEDEDPVRLLLNGVTIHHSKNAAIAVLQAEKTIIVALDGSINTLSDGSSYTFEGDEDEPNATLFSSDDLTIYGTGTLNISANYNDGISSKDGLIINGTTINIEAFDDGIRGKDYTVISNAVIEIEASGDGIKSDNDEDSDRGYLLIHSGIFTIYAGNDALQAATDLLIVDGEFTLTSGGGSSYSYSSSESQKSLKATSNIVIDGGIFTISSADDALHSNGHITINGGTFDIASGDDGIHADTSITINEGTFDITKSYEGIESLVIVINEGDFNIVSSDDGINVAGGNDGSSNGRPGGSSSSSASSDYYLAINDGFIVVNASGDGIDSNGSIQMTGGTVLVHGPTSNNNGALDYDGTFLISGGTLIAAGSSGMAQSPSTSSEQYSVYIQFSSTKDADTYTHIESNAGDPIFTFELTKSTQSIVISTPEFSSGSNYSFYTGGSATGDATGGFYDDASTYIGGTVSASFTINGKVSSVSGS